MTQDTYVEKIPAYLRNAMTERGICIYDITAYEYFDMLQDKTYADCWLLIDERRWYIFYGKESFVKERSRFSMLLSPRKAMPMPEYTLTGFDSGDIAEIKAFKVERYVATARLVAEYNDGTSKEICIFSLGIAAKMETLIRRFEAKRHGDVYHENHDFEGKRENFKSMSERVSVFRRLMGFFFMYLPKLVIVFGGMLIGTLFSVASPYIGTKLLYDDVLTPGVNDSLYGQVGLVLAIIIGSRLFQLGINMLQQYVNASVVPWVVNDLKVRIFSAMQSLPLSFFSNKQTGALMERVNSDSDSVYWFFVHGFPNIIINVCTFIGVAIIMLIMNLRLTLLIFCFIPVLFFAYKFLHRAFRKMNFTVWLASTRMNSHISESMTGIRLIKAFAKENEESERFEDYSEYSKDASLKLANTSDFIFPVISFAATAMSLIILAVGGVMIINGTDGMTIGSLMTFTSYMTMLYGPLDFFTRIINRWSRCVDAASRMFEIIDSKSKIKEAENPVRMPDMKGNIDVCDVSFEYEPGHPVIRNLSLSVKAGQMVGIVGKTGAGKSTTVNLMARLYDVTEGQIKIDGVDVRDIAIEDMRRNIGIVSQEIYLFMGSVADNIRYANPSASMEQVVAAAKAAAAHDFIMRLPDGYETQIGSGGQALSGGERQRISIARTIIQNPRILILDEATASMDTETERRIQQSISSLKEGRTTVAIAHRLSTLRDADVLAVINKGRMIEYGTHAELMRENGEYAKLYSLQFDALKFIGFD